MVGEIRDGETADIAVEAALTGHLVLSTLHAGDAASSIHRIIDMGIPPFLLASSLLAVVSQRLVRIICDRCRAPDEPSEQLLKGLDIPAPSSGRVAYYRGSGCHSCGRTGYKGRTGIFEVLAVDDAVRDLIMAQAPAAEIAECAVGRGMRTLWDGAVSKVTDGITTIEEVLRVTRR
jgi:type II secretory ATPase GspE/PulE/Tfp pilus assembly ATPase PilB-like protein